ncbi:hypothetical protein K435DRAFT_800405 [Dendrothele bispora CBS 962.96]|uniref:Uncharacterized protein n=1 Tax=Dendrothele bispora (strain CBS 962.96) TaxID=1314807 RepID=A0A4S8LU54_DENBC|nr:hypothetical protein K435DRAFT_800405 [Dendrothele bispora CBS 962.96]
MTEIKKVVSHEQHTARLKAIEEALGSSINPNPAKALTPPSVLTPAPTRPLTPSLDNDLSAVFAAAVSLKNKNEVFYRAHEEAEVSHSNFNELFSAFSQEYQTPSLMSTPTRARVKGNTPLTSPNLLAPIMWTPAILGTSSTQLSPVKSALAPATINTSPEKPEETTIPTSPSTLSPRNVTWVVYLGVNEIDGIYYSWVESEPKKHDGAFYTSSGNKSKIVKGFKSHECAKISYNETKESGVLALLKNREDKQMEKFLVLQGVQPGIYTKRFEFMSTGLGWRGGIVERHLVDDVMAVEIFEQRKDEGKIAIIHADDHFLNL